MHSSFIVFILCTLTPMMDGNNVIKDRHSLAGPYESDTMDDWFLAGNAVLTPNFVSLTQDEPNTRGAIWNIHQCFSADWEMQLHFHIYGRGRNLHGDGMAVWYVQEPLHLGPVFGYKNFFTGLGVFIDTFENENDPIKHNHRHPYISAMVNNGSLKYEHDEDGTYTQIGGCHVEVRGVEHMTKIAISYIEDTLAVYVDAAGTGQWGTCFRAPGVHLPTGYHFGMSASTSDLADHHDVVSLTTLEFHVPRPDIEARAHIIPHAEFFQAPKEYVKSKEEVQEHVQAEFAKEMKEEIMAEVVKEVKEEIVVEVVKEVKEEIKPEVVKEAKQKKKQKPKTVVEQKLGTTIESPADESSVTKTSLFTKSIYIIGSLLIISVGVSLCTKYLARRKEAMQKRLY